MHRLVRRVGLLLRGNLANPLGRLTLKLSALCGVLFDHADPLSVTSKIDFLAITCSPSETACQLFEQCSGVGRLLTVNYKIDLQTM